MYYLGGFRHRLGGTIITHPLDGGHNVIDEHESIA